MVYRKGESPVPRPLDRWAHEHPVARMIANGDRWFMAWIGQKTTPLHRLEKLTGIPRSRLEMMSKGGSVSRAELEALARAWSISTGDLIRSMADTVEIVE